MFSENQIDLIKVKRSYIQYMDQINRMYGYPRNYIGVLFTLIMEKGKELTGNYKGLLSYRIGNYRIIYTVLRDKTVLILRIGHRKDIYK